ncbi:MAG: DNRLRE domain-containing protein, partial [Promethearchaeota archaeon]
MRRNMILILLGWILIISTISCPVVTSQGIETYAETFYPIDDAFVVQENPDTNFNTMEDTIWCAYSSTSFSSEGPYTTYSYLKFNISSIPDNAVMWQSYFEIQTKDYDYDECNVQLHYVEDTSWDEDSITWNTRPTFDITDLTGPDEDIAHDETYPLGLLCHFGTGVIMLDKLQADFITFALRVTTFGKAVHFYSSESSPKPRLYIEWVEHETSTVPTTTPTSTLQPSSSTTSTITHSSRQYLEGTIDIDTSLEDQENFEK